MPNPFTMLRSKERPYAIYTHILGWEWRVLQTYLSPEDEASHPEPYWFVAAKSENTFGIFELGDVEAELLKKSAVLVAATPEWYKFYGHGKPFPKFIKRLKP